MNIQFNETEIVQFFKIGFIFKAFHEVIFKKLFNDKYAYIFTSEKRSKNQLIIDTDNKFLQQIFNRSYPKNSDDLISYFFKVKDERQLFSYNDYITIVKYCSSIISNFSEIILFTFKNFIDLIYFMERRLPLELFELPGAYKPKELIEIGSLGEKFKDLEMETIDCTKLVFDKNQEYIYFENEIEFEKITSLDQLTKKIMFLLEDKNEKHFNDINKKEYIFFRGHAQSNYLLKPSISRNNYLNYENKMYEELLVKNSSDFDSCKSNLDVLKKMQHYGLPTRLIDISRNLMVGLYMAIENDSSSQNENYDGEIIVFYDETIKTSRSDSVSIIASLPRLKIEDNVKISNHALTVTIEEIIKNKTLYTLKDIEKYSNRVILKSDKDFVDRLYQQIKYEKPGFQNKILSKEMLYSYIVIPTQDNQRIIRQDGAFIICSLNRYINDDLNRLRLLNTENKKLIFIIDKSKKSYFREQLSIFGYTHAHLFPEIDQVASYIKKKNVHEKSDYTVDMTINKKLQEIQRDNTFKNKYK